MQIMKKIRLKKHRILEYDEIECQNRYVNGIERVSRELEILRQLDHELIVRTFEVVSLV